MEKELKRLAEKLCKDKACKIQYCLQGEFYYSINGVSSTCNFIKYRQVLVIRLFENDRV